LITPDAMATQSVYSRFDEACSLVRSDRQKSCGLQGYHVNNPYAWIYYAIELS
jgi:hypothetical protein